MKKILIADDVVAIVDAIKIILEDSNYEVISTTDGSQVSKLIKQNPDLILLDIWMSGMDGGEICKKLKKDPKTKHIPVIIISANKDTKKIAENVGADDFIAKPFDLTELLDKVGKHLSKN